MSQSPNRKRVVNFKDHHPSSDNTKNGSNMGNSNNNNDRIEINPDYESVQVRDDDDDESNNDADDEDDVVVDDYDDHSQSSSSSPHRRRHHRRAPPMHNNATASGLLCFVWLGLMVVLGVMFVVLLEYRQHISYNENHSAAAEASSSSSDNNKKKNNNKDAGKTMQNDNNNNNSPVHYDPSFVTSTWDPFDLTGKEHPKNNNPLLPPVLPFISSNDEQQQPQRMTAYFQQPNLVNNTLAFVSEGDLYWTQLLQQPPPQTTTTTTTILPAMKLTTTMGNVHTIRIHPQHTHLIAYTATYQGRRDIYLLDLLQSSGRMPAAQRLTYWDMGGFGITDLVGWNVRRQQTKSSNGQQQHSLVFAASSHAVALPDTRLYEIVLTQGSSSSSSTASSSSQQQQQQQQEQQLSVLQIQPIPLSQALEAAFFTVNENSSNNNIDDGDQDCLVFTRFRQSSRTVRYVGGTTESLWAYCHGEELAVPLTADYVGTSKCPSIFPNNNNGNNKKKQQQQYLLFLSDRSPVDNKNNNNNKGGWRPMTMNLWAMPLPTKESLYGDADLPMPIQLTRISCQFNGLALQEYALDPVTGNLVLRIGADFHFVSASDWMKQVEQNDANVDGSLNQAPPRLNLQVMSDFHELQERLLPLDLPKHITEADVFQTSFGSTSMLLTLRGQVWVVPVMEYDTSNKQYQGAGQNMPGRRYRVVPGSMTGGAVRVLKALQVPLYANPEESSDLARKKRFAVILATDPVSATAEHAFYLIPIDAEFANEFSDLDHLPKPFLGGHVNGGSTQDGGLGSVQADSMKVSPCGRRLAWADKDGRICVMTLPLYSNGTADYHVLPSENELGEPMDGDSADLAWSPGGRYLAVVHNARNQFRIVSLVDCGDPEKGDIHLDRVVQATPSRFNSYSLYWGKSSMDLFLYKHLAFTSAFLDIPEPGDVSTTLYFLTDRDIMSDVMSPWGTRAPAPHFPDKALLYALPLTPAGDTDDEDIFVGRFPGGGALELFKDAFDALDKQLKLAAEAKKNGVKKEENNDGRRKLQESYSTLSKALKGGKLGSHQVRTLRRYLRSVQEVDDGAVEATASPFPKDMNIDFGGKDLSFAREAYRVANVPEADYMSILAQTYDDGSLVLVERGENGPSLTILMATAFPSDQVASITKVVSKPLSVVGLSTNRDYIYALFTGTDAPRVIENTSASLSAFIADFTDEFNKNVADTKGIALSIWPQLEYQQMFNDAWRMFRDYFYDKNMHGLDWPAIHERYKPLVARCSKREELDDVLGQMASELSALHVFVYGGEYNAPFNGDEATIAMHTPASLGATLVRAPEWKGYRILEIPERDPDFNLMDGSAVYSPLSDRALSPTGQRGLAVGDVIVGINGESVMSVPDIHMLLRGMAGRSVRLHVLRLSSGKQGGQDPKSAVPKPVVVVPISPLAASVLQYDAWEWKTRQKAVELATKAGFSVAYIHMRDMMLNGENAFARSFFPDYDKQGLILDLRHNGGGNIDSWILDALQKKAWMFWGDRKGTRRGDIDWDEQFAFRGHVVVLINEHTGSDAEGVSRGISELGLGKLIGTRTWGGGIWLSSDNRLVDGGLASAPEIGTFNSNFDWGLGIEQQGVHPDVEVDNNPRTSFDGKDSQLERAISELKMWLKQEPVVEPKEPGPKPVKALLNDDCPA